MKSTQQVAEAGKASFETAFALAGKTFEGVEQLTELNLQLVKTLLAENAQKTLVVLSAKSPEDLVKLQTEALQAAPRQALAYARQVQAIVAKVADAYREAGEAQAVELEAWLFEALNGALKNLPGNEETLALAKTAIATAKSAYESANKASRQVADAVVEKFTEAA